MYRFIVAKLQEMSLRRTARARRSTYVPLTPIR